MSKYLNDPVKAYHRSFRRKLEKRLKGSSWEVSQELVYGFEFIGYGGENSAVVFLAGGQGGSTRVVMIRTACDGGEHGDREVPIRKNFRGFIDEEETATEIIEAIWEGLTFRG